MPPLSPPGQDRRRVAQWESTSLTRKGSGVRYPSRLSHCESIIARACPGFLLLTWISAYIRVEGSVSVRDSRESFAGVLRL